MKDQIYNNAKLEMVVALEKRIASLAKECAKSMSYFPGITHTTISRQPESMPMEAMDNLLALAGDLVKLSLVLEDNIYIISGYRPIDVDKFFLDNGYCRRIFGGHDDCSAADILIETDNLIITSAIIIEMIRDGYFDFINYCCLHFGFYHIGKASKQRTSPLYVVTDTAHNSCQIISGLLPRGTLLHVGNELIAAKE